MLRPITHNNIVYSEISTKEFLLSKVPQITKVLPNV